MPPEQPAPGSWAAGAWRARRAAGAPRMALMSAEDLERYETEIELQLYKEYKDVAQLFRYVIETERRFYLANGVTTRVHGDAARPFVELELSDAWVWDMYRPARFVQQVRVLTFNDVNIEELPGKEL